MEWLWRFDMDAFKAIHIGLHRDWLDPIFFVLSSTGLGWMQMAIVLGVPLFRSKRMRDWRKPSFRESLRLMFKATYARWCDPIYLVGPLIVTFVVSGGVLSSVLAKRIVERERPSNFIYAMPQEWIFGNSYPSGHTTTSFAIAFTLLFSTMSTRKAWVGWVALVWASLVGFCRIYRGVHWPTDVFGGICAGLVAACFTHLVLRKAAEALRLDEDSRDAKDRELVEPSSG